jgi:hypothetical protein
MCLKQIYIHLFPLLSSLLLFSLSLFSGFSNPKCNTVPTNKLQSLQLINACLAFLREEENFKLTNIGAEDVYIGNYVIVMGLMWQIVSHYQIGMSRSHRNPHRMKKGKPFDGKAEEEERERERERVEKVGKFVSPKPSPSNLQENTAILSEWIRERCQLYGVNVGPIGPGERGERGGRERGRQRGRDAER